MAAERRYLRYDKEELDEIKALYESIMAVASQGLFYRSGKIIGKRFAGSGDGDPFENASRMLVEEQWASEVMFDKEGVRVKNSIESVPGKGEPTCHILRGVISKIVESKEGGACTVKEVKCVSKGDSECVFEVRGGAK